MLNLNEIEGDGPDPLEVPNELIARAQAAGYRIEVVSGEDSREPFVYVSNSWEWDLDQLRYFLALAPDLLEDSATVTLPADGCGCERCLVQRPAIKDWSQVRGAAVRGDAAIARWFEDHWLEGDVDEATDAEWGREDLHINLIADILHAADAAQLDAGRLCRLALDRFREALLDIKAHVTQSLC